MKRKRKTTKASRSPPKRARLSEDSLATLDESPGTSGNAACTYGQDDEDTTGNENEAKMNSDDPTNTSTSQDDEATGDQSSPNSTPPARGAEIDRWQ